jgi:hypothetical protein
MLNNASVLKGYGAHNVTGEYWWGFNKWVRCPWLYFRNRNFSHVEIITGVALFLTALMWSAVDTLFINGAYFGCKRCINKISTFIFIAEKSRRLFSYYSNGDVLSLKSHLKYYEVRFRDIPKFSCRRVCSTDLQWKCLNVSAFHLKWALWRPRHLPDNFRCRPTITTRLMPTSDFGLYHGILYLYLNF